MSVNHNLIAYLATLGAITGLAIVAAAVCLFAGITTEVGLARVIGALAFISGAIQGLTGVIGTFKASQSPTTTNNIAEAGTVNAPGTQGTNPVEEAAK